NPIEQEGTYPLPEAQLDRFLMHVQIGYPHADAELGILELARKRARMEGPSAGQAPRRLSSESILAARHAVLDLHLSAELERYMVELVLATRDAARYDAKLGRQIAFGASPRGTIALERCARAHAWLEGRDYVTPSDVRAIANDVLRHRVLLSFEAEADGVGSDEIVNALLERVPVP
ncbi:MAG: MoxR family ATPase, partial [Xanthomonadales bacterium]|nr:MoxR family ATPase [Xanthomonadales bacterium]